MRLVSFRRDGRASWGALDEEGLRDLSGLFPDLRAALAADEPERLAAAAWSRPPGPATGVTWLPVIPAPAKILCIGLNYQMHRAETGRAETAHPTIFTRFADSQIGHQGAIVKPVVSDELDFEGELAVIIGRAGRAIPRDEAMAHVAGYACYNDASVRDWQRHTSQFTPGKNFPATGGFGPWMVTRDALPLPGGRRLRTRLNDVIVQDAGLEEMIFDIPCLIAYCSAFTPLAPGDVIVTGTPGGIGARRDPPLWLRPGDRVSVEIDGLGRLENRVVAEDGGAGAHKRHD